LPAKKEKPRDKKLLMSMLRKMYEIRLAEEAVYHAFLSEPMPGTIHQSIGEEAVAVGICHALRVDDYVTSTHRGHAHAIAKGATLRSFFAEIYAKSTGMSGGMGGSMHLFDKEHGFLGSIGIVGAGTPIACGAALAAQLEGKGQVAVAFFGDGASNQGAVHEAMNLAAVWKLPVVFVCENNLYAVSTPVSKSMAVEQVADRAVAYGMLGVTVDGMDVLEVYDQAVTAVERARRGGGPTLVECITYRFKGHSRFEPATYRPSGELEEWMAKDPIPRLRRFLAQQGLVSEAKVDALKAEVEVAVKDAIAFAKASPDVDPSQVPSFVFA
jgi:TPP-dependent pyruvate/acetoin dehydrogenase alpha subunit